MSTNNNQTMETTKKLTKDEIKRAELESSLKNSVVDAMTQKTVIKTENGTMLNELLLGRKKQTLSMYRVFKAYWSRLDPEGPFHKSVEDFKLAESRLTRFFDSNVIIVPKKLDIPLNDGRVISAEVDYPYNDLKDCPILFVEFVGEPLFEDPFQSAVYEECKKFIAQGLPWNYKGELIRMEYCQSSASEMRTLKGMFVREDFKFSEEYLAKFKPASDSLEDMEEFTRFIDTMRSLRGPEVIYTAMSYGAYLLQYKGTEESAAKFMARMGMSQTSTKSLGNDFKVKCIGEIKFPWTDEIEEEHNILYTSMADKHGKPLFSEEGAKAIINKIKNFWKEEKVDGQNVIKASAVVRGFKKLGIKLRTVDVIGKLMQFRWAGVKGTALVVPDSWFGVPSLPDGTHPYADYDLIVEKSSWKYSPWVKYWNGDLAPELELVAMSKQRCSNNMNYQFVLALDGDGNREIKTAERLKGLIDKRYNFAVEAMSNSEVAKASLGIKSREENDLEDILDIDDYERSLTTVMAKALDACDDIIYDRSWRYKFVNRLIKARDKMSYGNVPVEGANRFVISDPTAFFRTDLAVPRTKGNKAELDYEGNPMFDIVITSIDQTALRGITSTYWNDEQKEAVLFRSPCVHPGEPQRVTLIGLDTIDERISAAYGDIPARDLFESMKDIVVVNCLSYTLDALGGADTDGDTVLVVTEPDIVELRSLRRAPTLVKIDSATQKCTITPANVKRYMIDSLKDAGIGRITNWSTTWREIELMVVHMPNPLNGKYKLPDEVVKALFNESKKYPGAAQLAKEALIMNRTNFDALELASAEATAALCDINNDSEFRKWAGLVVKACELNIELIRRLQETAINTAKSGVFVEFDRYTWLKLKVRASWHRPDSKNKFDSWSSMGQMSTYAEDKWDKLREWAGKTSKPLNIGQTLDWTQYRKKYDVIKQIKSNYGTLMHNLNRGKEMRDEDGTVTRVYLAEEEKREICKELSDQYNAMLRSIAVEIGSMDAVSIMVYHAINDRDKDNDEGISFMWMCWGNEFVHTLRHLNSGKKSKRLVVVEMNKEYADRVIPAGQYLVRDNKLRFTAYPEDPVAHVRVPDGEYEIMVFDEKPYLLAEIIKSTVESMAATMKNTRLALIGYKYMSFEGNALTRDKVKELLERGNYAVTTRIVEKELPNGKIFVGAMVSVELPGVDTPVYLGNIPTSGGAKDESKYLSNALNKKVLRVCIPKDADKRDINKDGKTYSKLTIEIMDVIEDLSK